MASNVVRNFSALNVAARSKFDARANLSRFSRRSALNRDHPSHSASDEMEMFVNTKNIPMPTSLRNGGAYEWFTICS
jgi:hypothetical protein